MSNLRALIDHEIEALKAIPLNGEIEKAAEIIAGIVANNNGKLVVSGVGKAGQVGTKLATTLSSTGIPACFLDPLNAQHGDLGIIQDGDGLFLISNSGKTREIIELVDLAKSLYPDIPIIVLTKNLESDLASSCALAIPTGMTEEICPLGLTPTTSTTVMTVITDLLTVELINRTGFTKSEYAKRHHGGYLGQKSKA